MFTVVSSKEKVAPHGLHLNSDTDGGVNKWIYHSLRNLRQGNQEGALFGTSRGLKEEVKKLRSLSLDYVANVFSALRPLTLFVEIEEAVSIAKDSGSLQSVLTTWQTRLDNLVTEFAFTDVENVYALRGVALGLIRNGHADEPVGNRLKETLYKHLVDYGRAARKAQNLQTAQYVLSRANSLWGVGNGAMEMRKGMLDKTLPSIGVMQILKTVWMQGDQGVAIRSLRAIVRPLVDDREGTRGGRTAIEGGLLCQLGKWIARSRSENPRYVLEKYFEQAVQAVMNGGDGRECGKAYYHLALYADEQYQEMLANDPREQLADLLKHKQAELASCEALAKSITGKDKTSDQQRAAYEFARQKLLKQIDIDKVEERRYLSDRSTFLEKAVENYLRTLEVEEGRWDMCTFRLCGLWFANTTHSGINAKIDAHIKQVPSHKFLGLVYQLSARMSAEREGDERDFQKVLEKLILKMATEHPYHCLYQIIALKNGGDGSKGRSSSSSRGETAQSAAAKHVLAKLKANANLSALMQNMDALADAYIDLALHRFEQKADKKRFKFERKWKISSMQDLEGVPVFTKELPVDPSGKSYRDLPYVLGFKSEFWSPGGVNQPKVVECLASDGKSYMQVCFSMLRSFQMAMFYPICLI